MKGHATPYLNYCCVPAGGVSAKLINAQLWQRPMISCGVAGAALSRKQTPRLQAVSQKVAGTCLPLRFYMVNVVNTIVLVIEMEASQIYPPSHLGTRE